MRRMVEVGCWRRFFAGIIALGAGFVLMAGGVAAHAQASAGNSGQQAQSYEVLHWNPSLTLDDGARIENILRNMVPKAKIYAVPGQHTISVLGAPDQLALARRIFDSLNHAKASYELTYTITESSNGTAASVRKVALRIVSGGTAEAKQGMRVPVTTGTYSSNGNGKEVSTQFQYVDFGVHINASLDGPGTGLGDTLRLQTRMNLSGMAGRQSVGNTQEPVIWNSNMNGPVTLTVGKTATLESVNLPGATPGGARHLTITVVAEPAA